MGLVGVLRQCGVVVSGCWWMVLGGCWAGVSWWMVLVGDGRAGVVSWCWLGRCWSVAIVGLGVFSSANGAWCRLRGGEEGGQIGAAGGCWRLVRMFVGRGGWVG